MLYWYAYNYIIHTWSQECDIFPEAREKYPYSRLGDSNSFDQIYNDYKIDILVSFLKDALSRKIPSQTNSSDFKLNQVIY